MRQFIITILTLCCIVSATAQKNQPVKIILSAKEKKVEVLIGGKLFTGFLFPDSLEKPVLYPVYTASGTAVTRGFPLNPQPGDPADHPHHIGIWFNFENVNGLDFWNNSYAIPANKKTQYGWIKTDKITETSSGSTGVLSYHANWANINKKILAQENTRYVFSGTEHQRIIDRITTITADTLLLFTDAKDGLLAIRVAHALQIPTDKDQKFTDDKGNATIVKGGTDKIANGNYVSSEGKIGDSVWSTRAAWCKMFGKINNDSVSVVIIDHPKNPNYPTYWHARGYGLFAANPLGEKIFTNGKKTKNLQLQKGESVTFRYRIVIDDANTTISSAAINKLADNFKSVK
jgi:Methane oxygenase PmoA